MKTSFETRAPPKMMGISAFTLSSASFYELQATCHGYIWLGLADFPSRGHVHVFWEARGTVGLCASEVLK